MGEQAVHLGTGRDPETAGGLVAPACHAPFSSLYLDPAGRVTACCANTYHPLGDLRSQTLTEIWRGGPARALRDRVADGRLDLGCELCAAEVGRGSAATAELRRFDPLAPSEADPPWPVQLELALSNACNLQCTMCNGELSSAIRIHREGRAPLPAVYGDAFFAELDAFLPHLRRLFLLGGEPFLGAEPLRVLDRLVELGLTPEVFVTTNGTQWSPRIERILAQLPLDVSVSVDGFQAATVEAIRVGVHHADLLRNIERYREATRAHGGGFSLTFCLQRANWRELGDVLAWGDELDLLVGVSTLTNPPHLGLHTLAAPALAEVAAGLRAEDPRRQAGLRRNRPAWDAAVARVEGLLHERVGLAEDGGSVDVLAAAEARAAAFADGRGVHRVHADASQLVVSVEPDPRDVLGVDLVTLPGGPTRALGERLRASLGPIVTSALEVHPDGVEERRLRFGGPDGATDVRAFLAPTGPTTHVWLLAARDAPAGRGVQPGS
ncbi:MAG: SPASM domain-containing protein [Acidimicrobiales bacterium]|nr:SPASM domain-containing protein [Acidimicrobiales bacterium]